MEFKDRFGQARKSKGLSQQEIARAFEISRAAVSLWEQGRSVPDPDKMPDLATMLGVQTEWLWSGRGDMSAGDQRTISLVGYVGAGAEIFPFDDHAMGSGLDELPAPPGLEDCVAVEVRGDSLYPAYWPGDRVYYRRYRDGVPSLALGQECVVQVHNGPMLIKTVKRGSAKGLFDLESYNAAPRPDQRLDWAAPVLWADKRGRFGGRA